MSDRCKDVLAEEKLRCTLPAGHSDNHENGDWEWKEEVHVPKLYTEAEVREREQKAREEEWEACAKLAESPYSDEVEASGLDQPFAVGKKIAAAIRARGGKT